MLSLKINTDDYPELKKYKKTVIQDKLKEIFELGYKLSFPQSSLDLKDNLILSKLESLEKNTPHISELNKSITQLLGITSNSNKKGEFVEGIIEDYINKKYPGMYDVKRSEAHSGDGWLKLPNKITAIVEVKGYSKTVGLCEVEKLKNDMKTHQIKFAIMISLSSNIQESNLIDLEIFNVGSNTYHIIKLNSVSEDYSRLEIGFKLLERITSLSNKSKKLLLDESLESNIKLLMDKINKNQELREMFSDLSKDITTKLDNFYQELTKLYLEQEFYINKICDEIKDNTFSEIKLTENKLKLCEKFKDLKVYPILIKMIDFLEKHKIKYKLNKDKIIISKGEIKITQDKINVNLNNPVISLSISSKNGFQTSNNKNWNLLETLINI